ncbi:VOC family protein [Streptomyces sp. NPDC001380]|uniref:VOC family protein n=1 Tax=Streptomyces sp. NPDC001380 TaxID=3364566 RepID=UPI0036A7CBCD
MSSHVVPDRYRYAAVPHVMVDDADAALGFYREAFGARELFRVPGPEGGVMHAEFAVGESVVMVGDAGGVFTAPNAGGGPSVGLHVFVEDVDALCRRAVDAGAELLQPPTDMFHGDRTAILRDPSGHVWIFLTHQEDPSAEEVLRRAAGPPSGTGHHA